MMRYVLGESQGHQYCFDGDLKIREMDLSSMTKKVIYKHHVRLFKQFNKLRTVHYQRRIKKIQNSTRQLFDIELPDNNLACFDEFIIDKRDIARFQNAKGIKPQFFNKPDNKLLLTTIPGFKLEWTRPEISFPEYLKPRSGSKLE